MGVSRTNPLVRLRAGVRSSSRGDGLLQVGNDPWRRVLLPDTLSVRQLLHLLPGGVRADNLGDLARVGHTLLAAGLAVDDDEQSLLDRARAATRVRVVASEPWHSTAVSWLQAAGLGVEVDGAAEPDDGPEDPLPHPTLLVHDGDPDRDEVDQLLRTGAPVLVVAVVDARVRVGPFIVAGRSPCLRCLDAHAAERDPWFRTCAETLPVAGPSAGVGDLLLTQALLSATVDLCAWAEGRQPTTWSATRTFDDSLRMEEVRWERHPHCGCTWAEGLVTV